MPQKILVGDGTWPFTATIDGEDICVRGKNTTWFGGDNDPMDSGGTASGLITKGHPELMGCALPMQIGPRGGSIVTFEPTHGSPLPKFPYKTTIVQVWCPSTNKTIRVPVIDLGPAKWACEQGAAIDLTQAAFRALGLSLAQGKAQVDYRVLGGVKFVM